MFCAKCGKEIDNDSTFCPFCGQKADEPVESGGGRKPKGSVKMPGKKVIGGIAAVAVVLLVVFGISKVIGGISNRTKSLPEKLFAMSTEEYVSLTREGFKDMLEEEGTLYQESDRGVLTLTTDDFMGYDCIYGYGAYDDDWGATPAYTAGLADCGYFILAFETEEDFKEGQKSVKKYLEKEMVKKSGILKTDGAVLSGDTYLVECSDKGTDKVWEKLSEMDDRESFYHDWIYYNPALAEQTDITDENEQINEEALLKALEDMDYKMYKFVQVCYPQMDSDTRSAFPSDKAYTDYMCDIQVTCLPMTEEDYIFFAGQWGYDAISGKEIDIDEFKESVNEELVDAYLNENASDDSERRRELEKELYIRLYMMENHNFDINSKMYIESKGGTVAIRGNNSVTIEPKDEVRLWYIRNFDWDTKTDAPIDLSAYRNSGDIYCAVEYNYNSDTAEYFESEFDQALYLADRDYKADTGESFGGTDDKRLWFMQNYNYDISSGKEVDKEVVDALIAYQKYIDEDRLNPYPEYGRLDIIGFTLIYIDDDTVPECVVLSKNSGIFIMSYKNGEIQSVSPEDHYTLEVSVWYTPRSGMFAIDSWSGNSEREWNIIELAGSFKKTSVLDRVNDYESGITYTLNGQVVSEGGDDEYGNHYLDQFNFEEQALHACPAIGDEYTNVYDSLLAAYDILRTTIYETYEYCIYEYELKDGVLTVKADDGANTSSSFGEQTAFEFSCPVADDCIWEAGNGFGEYRSVLYSMTPEEMEVEIKNWRNMYELTPDNMESPVAVQFHIIDDQVVGVYTSMP